MSRYRGFQDVQLTRPKRSLFDMSHEKKIAFRMGKLIPMLCVETLPGDTWRFNPQVLIRVLPMLAPIYAYLKFTCHFWFVPNRIIWKDWATFWTGGQYGPGLTTAPIVPYMPIDDLQAQGVGLLEESSLADYLGVPIIDDAAPDYTEDTRLNVLPFAAYSQIWFEFYRDRNFAADEDYFGLSEPFPLDSGKLTDMHASMVNIFLLRQSSWGPEYFVTALPFTQRGSEVLMPLEGTGSVTYLPNSEVRTAAGGIPLGQNLTVDSSGGGNLTLPIDGTTGRIENIDEVNLTSSDVSINDLRSAIALQHWMERNAIAGSRPSDATMAHFGVRPQDYRLQRPEFIGGFSMPIQISEVLTTAYSLDEADNVIPPANMTGHGVGRGGTGLSYYCTEHGFIMAIMRVMTPATYQQGLHRMFKRDTFLDYAFPEFAQLGEQSVYNYELFVSPATLTIDPVSGEYPDFGFQSRYVDWKSMPSTSHGAFRTTLLHWTLTRTFAALPTIGVDFVEFEDVLQDRIFAVAGSNNFLAYVYNKCSVVRCLPYYGSPQLVG